MNTLINTIDKYPAGTIIIIKWKNELEVKGEIDSFYDADNGLNKDEDGYKRFYACSLYIVEILKETTGYAAIEDEDFIYVSMQNPPQEMKRGYYNIKGGGWLEISIQNLPIEVKLEDGTVIWSKDTVSTEI